MLDTVLIELVVYRVAKYHLEIISSDGNSSSSIETIKYKRNCNRTGASVVVIPNPDTQYADILQIMGRTMCETSLDHRHNNTAPGRHGGDCYNSQYITFGLAESGGLGSWEHDLLDRCFHGAESNIDQ